MENRYFGGFSDVESINNSFTIPDSELLKDEEVLFASYGGYAYEGDAIVVFQRDGVLYEAHGGHCSCNGLEDQWSPEETSWHSLAVGGPSAGEHGAEVVTAYDDMVQEHLPSGNA